jgi:hypothetical protein
LRKTGKAVHKYILNNSPTRREADGVVTATRETQHPEALFARETTIQIDRCQLLYR